MKKSSFLVIVSFLILSVGCKKEVPVADKPTLSLSKDEKNVTAAANEFSFNLLRAVQKEEENQNQFISPLSVSFAIGMLYNGAEGQTKEDIQNALQLHGLSPQQVNLTYKKLIELLPGLDPEVKFAIANSIWYRKGFDVKPTFLDMNKEYFKSTITDLDFSDPASVDIINSWVKDKTNNKIEKIVDNIPQNVVMYLINALYFNGTWKYQFDSKETASLPFTKADGTTKNVPMMQMEREWNTFTGSNYKGVDLPYGDGVFSMTLLLPNDDVSVQEVIAELSDNKFQSAVNSISANKVILQMPKLKLEYEKQLEKALTDLDMGIIFTDQADLSGIAESGGLRVSEVKHKTFVDVNEKGTEAAAVTSVVVTVSLPPTISFNKPYVFVIREKESNTILFMGKIMEPVGY